MCCKCICFFRCHLVTKDENAFTFLVYNDQVNNNKPTLLISVKLSLYSYTRLSTSLLSGSESLLHD